MCVEIADHALRTVGIGHAGDARRGAFVLIADRGKSGTGTTRTHGTSTRGHAIPLTPDLTRGTGTEDRDLGEGRKFLGDSMMTHSDGEGEGYIVFDRGQDLINAVSGLCQDDGLHSRKLDTG